MVFPIWAEEDLQFAPNFPPALRREIMADLHFLDSIHGDESSRLHQEIFGVGPLDGHKYTQFLRTYIASFSFSTSDSPYQIQTDGNRNLYIFASYLPFARAVSGFSRAVNFMHEAFHNSGHFHHVKCPSPFLDERGNEIVTNVGHIPLSGLLACDEGYKSSYGIEIIIAKNVERYCKNCSEALRREASLYADDLMKRIVSPRAREALYQDLYKISAPIKVGEVFQNHDQHSL